MAIANVDATHLRFHTLLDMFAGNPAPVGELPALASRELPPLEDAVAVLSSPASSTPSEEDPLVCSDPELQRLLDGGTAHASQVIDNY